MLFQCTKCTMTNLFKFGMRSIQIMQRSSDSSRASRPALHDSPTLNSSLLECHHLEASPDSLSSLSSAGLSPARHWLPILALACDRSFACVSASVTASWALLLVTIFPFRNKIVLCAGISVIVAIYPLISSSGTYYRVFLRIDVSGLMG